VTAERAAREKAEQQARLAATGQLAAGIAHDFNNILSVVLTHAGLLRHDAALPDDARLKLRAIADQARRGARLVRQVLDFARGAPTRRQRVDLAACVRQTVSLLERTIPRASSSAPRCRRATGWPRRIRSRSSRWWPNLALNARDAMPGGGRLRIELSRRPLKESETPAGCGHDAWRMGRALGGGHRLRHVPRRAAPHLRAVLFHQDRERNGARAWRRSTAS